jgi:hypothetical protein
MRICIRICADEASCEWLYDRSSPVKTSSESAALSGAERRRRWFAGAERSLGPLLHDIYKVLGPPVVVRAWAKAGRSTASRFGRRSSAGAEAAPTPRDPAEEEGLGCAHTKGGDLQSHKPAHGAEVPH